MKFLIQLMKFALVVGLVACGVVFAMDNQSEYTFWFLGRSYDLPAWRPVLTGFLSGAGLSCCFFAVQTFKNSMELWRMRRRLKQCEPMESAHVNDSEDHLTSPIDSHQP
ncbi:MAG: LapA family protein [Oligoflexales bacterium]